jgi:hypothetical protein
MVSILGHIDTNRPKVYVLESGEKVTFHTARLRSNPQVWVTFTSPFDEWPSIMAARLGVEYSFMRNSTQDETNTYIIENSLHVAKTEEVPVQ